MKGTVTSGGRNRTSGAGVKRFFEGIHSEAAGDLFDNARKSDTGARPPLRSARRSAQVVYRLSCRPFSWGAVLEASNS
jgi:hypothetical protein